MSTKMKTIFTLIACLALLTAASAQVMINEVLYDTVGDDNPDLLYTEIYGPAGTNLDGWTLVGINGNGGAEYRTVQLEGDIPDDGYFVVGNTASVPNVDDVVGGSMGAGVDWQNAGSSSGDDCDGLELRNSSGTVVDAVCYGPCAAGHICHAEGDNAPDPFPAAGVNNAIARVPDHSDTQDNSVDFVAVSDLTPGAPNEGEPCDPVYASLEDIRENDGSGVPELMGTFVIVEGVVNVNNLTLQDISNFFIQNESAGCNVFGGGATTIAEGDCVRVSAWVSHYNGLTELVTSGTGNCAFSCQVTNHVASVDPVTLTCGSFFESYEGMLAQIDNVTMVGGDAWPTEGNNASIEISDGQGTITLRIVDDTNVDGSPEPQGAFTVVGIITQYDFNSPYDDFYQITPRYATDIHPLSAADDPIDNTMPAEFRLDGAFPNPFNSTTNLRFTVGNASELTVHVFDLLGREVAAEKLMNLTPGSHVWNWTPAGATGLYIVRVESENVVETAKLLYLK